MLRITNLKLKIGEDFSKLLEQSGKLLQIHPEDIQSYSIVKQSIDARKKQEIHYLYTLDVALHSEKKESQVLKHCKSRQVSAPTRSVYRFPPVTFTPKAPVVVGMGPAGLFCALSLAKAGIPPIVLERGQPVEQRLLDVEKFWQTGILDENSNVQFGEGGAGTFSDGKLTTGTKDPRNGELFRLLVELGAPKDILYSHKPHIGSDVLVDVLKNLRKKLLSLGCDLRFGQQVIGLETSGNHISGLKIRSEEKEYSLPASHVVLALGHSARDTFSLLWEENIPIEQKKFAIGARIEHLQADISKAQYGEHHSKLPPTDYKLACHLPNGRSVFSFCVCPGGVVVNASSQQGQVVTNGMSYRQRDHKNINGGLLVAVSPEDFHGYEGFDGAHPLAGMYFQEHWESLAYTMGQGNATCQRLGDFLQSIPSTGCGTIVPSCTSGVHYGDIGHCLPTDVSVAMRESIPHLAHKVQGFDCPDALLTAIETRSSSPIRILRNDSFQSTLAGLYPCGEGAGYAGGIVSAAVDGMRVAEAMVTLP